MNRWRKKGFEIPSHCEKPVPIISDAGMATESVGDGKLIPILIVDSTGRADIDDLIRFHNHTPAGDVRCTWGSNRLIKFPHSIEKVALFLEFERPIKTFAILEFSVVSQGVIVQSILESKAFYLQVGRKGDRFIHDMDRHKILVEVPDTGFREFWEKLWHKNFVRKFMKDGLSRKNATKAATDIIVMMKDVSLVRA